MKKFLLQLLFVLPFVLMANSCNQTKSDQIKIGANLTLTGDVAWWSLELKKGIDLALEEQNNPNVTIVYEDNEFKANKAVSIFNKFMKVDKVDAIITCFSPITEALIPLAENHKIPLIASCTSSTNITADKTWSFRDYFTQKEQCFPLAEYIYKQGFRKGVYMVINDDYGLDAARQFQKRFEQLGGVIMTGEQFSQLERSTRNEVVKVLSVNPDFIFVVARDQALITLCHQIRELDPKIQIVGINAFDSPIIWDNLGEAGEGVIFSSGFFNNVENEESKKFHDSFVNKYHEEPNYNAIYGYTIAQYLVKYISESQDSETLRLKLENMNEPSVRGLLTTDDVHGIIGTIGIYERKNNITILKE